MNPTGQPSFEELFPLPEGVKLRTRKFGMTPPPPLVRIPMGRDDRPTLTLRWEDIALGLTVLVREQPLTGKLIAEVFCTNPAMVNKAAVSVTLVGRHEHNMIRRTVKLDRLDTERGGCCG